MTDQFVWADKLIKRTRAVFRRSAPHGVCLVSRPTAAYQCTHRRRKHLKSGRCASVASKNRCWELENWVYRLSASLRLRFNRRHAGGSTLSSFTLTTVFNFLPMDRTCSLSTGFLTTLLDPGSQPLWMMVMSGIYVRFSPTSVSVLVSWIAYGVILF